MPSRKLDIKYATSESRFFNFIVLMAVLIQNPLNQVVEWEPPSQSTAKRVHVSGVADL